MTTKPTPPRKLSSVVVAQRAETAAVKYGQTEAPKFGREGLIEAEVLEAILAGAFEDGYKAALSASVG